MAQLHNRVMLSVVIPAYNEEERISPTLLRIDEYMKSVHASCEIIVVDDGSTDAMQKVVARIAEDISSIRLIKYQPNRGKGFAVRQGVLASKGDFVLISDADLSTPIDEIAVLLPHITCSSDGNCSIAIGSRALSESRIIVKQPWWRRAMGKIFNRVVRILVIDEFSDTQCGFKLFEGAAARQLFSRATVDRFAYDVEILLLAQKMGFRIKEVPVRWLNSPNSKVDPLSDSLQMLKDLIKIKLFMRRFKIFKPADREAFDPIKCIGTIRPEDGMNVFSNNTSYAAAYELPRK